MEENKNEDVLGSFVSHCIDHPNERFWQALRNWSGFPFIFASRGDWYFKDGEPHPKMRDTFYFEGKDK